MEATVGDKVGDAQETQWGGRQSWRRSGRPGSKVGTLRIYGEGGRSRDTIPLLLEIGSQQFSAVGKKN